MDLHDAQLPEFVAAHGVDFVVVRDEDGVVLTQTHLLDLQVHVGLDHGRVLYLAPELRVHAQLALIVVSPQKEALGLGDASRRVECTLDLRKLTSFEFIWILALQSFFREPQLVFVVRTPPEDPTVDREGQRVCCSCTDADDFFFCELLDVHGLPGDLDFLSHAELPI